MKMKNKKIFYKLQHIENYNEKKNFSIQLTNKSESINIKLQQ